jgi:carboxyl-terminal processing protease
MSLFGRIRFFGVIIAITLFGVPAKAAELELVGREMVRMLQNSHYARLPFNEKLSARFLERYLAELDGERVYFLQKEVVSFRRRYERRLHNLIAVKKVMPVAKEIYDRYRERVLTRVQFSRKYLEAGKFDFTGEREVLKDRSQAEWAVDGPTLQQLWRDLVDQMVLEEMLRRHRLRERAKTLGKPDPFRDSPKVAAKVLKKFDQLERTVIGVTMEEVAAAFFSAITQSYDPHSEYLSANEMERFRIDVSNELVGIGAQLGMNDDGEMEVRGLVRNGPADRGGQLRLGDRIFAVAPSNQGKWEDITFQTTNEVIDLILGEEGSEVGFRLRRKGENDDEVAEVVIKRGVVTLKDELARARVYDFGNEGEPWKVAVMVIPSFYFDIGDRGSRVSVHVEQLLGRLVKEGIKGLVLDLRDNTGGSLSEVQRLTGFFVGEGPVVQVRSSNGQILSLDSFHRKPVFDGPLVVMTNQNSASATEILAGALQDYHRAILIGAPSTFGKGTVQKTMDIADYMPVFSDRDRAGWLKLTFQKYYRVSGSSVQLRGVVPDLILPDTGKAGERERRYALPHDVIRASERFLPADPEQLFLPMIREKSAARVAQEPFFGHLFGEIKRQESLEKQPMVSLNLAKRMAELEAEEERRNAWRSAQQNRFVRMREDDKKRLKVYRLTLDDLKKDDLALDSTDGGVSDFMKVLEDEVGFLEKELSWPAGIDAVEREALSVIRDLSVAQADR